MAEDFTRIRVIDSHTGGEPTRVVIEGGPDLGGGSLSERMQRLADEHDGLRSCVVNEPRGSDVIVGALLCEPVDPTCTTGVIYFNNVGYLGMCVHGTIGLVATLAHMGRMEPGTHRIETPVGVVGATLHPDRSVTVDNVESYRTAQAVEVKVSGLGSVHGDVAWGGNWFFLVQDHGQSVTPDNTERLTEVAWLIRMALEEQGICGEDGGVIDHIELYGPPSGDHADSRCFVLCPGKAYDRSPCGTGTSAKLACLAADGRLAQGQRWRQESIVGSLFECVVRPSGRGVIPSLTGRAWITAESWILIDPTDPFGWGLGS